MKNYSYLPSICPLIAYLNTIENHLVSCSAHEKFNQIQYSSFKNLLRFN